MKQKSQKKFDRQILWMPSVLLCLCMLVLSLSACTKTYVTSEWEEVISEGKPEGIIDSATGEKPAENTAPQSNSSSGIKDSEKDSNTDNTVSVGEQESYYVHSTEAMRKASVLNKGDTTRLASKIKAALKDKKHNTTIACFGDSITEGSAASSMSKHYSSLFRDWWSKNISSAVTLINKGIGGTVSYFGLHWADEAILKHKPDIIFIEYVNDKDEDKDSLYAMDSLVRKCLSLDNKPAVILLEMSYNLNGTLSNAQKTHMKVAKPYGVPVISWRDAIKNPILNGELKWRDVSPDIVHPNDKGHALLTELMVSYVSSVVPQAATAGEPKAFSAAAVTDERYKNAKILDRDNLTAVDEGSFTAVAKADPFRNGWATTSGGSITFKMSFKTLGLIMHKTNDGVNGKITVEVDGKKIIFDGSDEIDGNWNESYDNIWAKRLYTYDSYAERTVKVTVVNGALDDFKILGWMVS